MAALKEARESGEKPQLPRSCEWNESGGITTFSSLVFQSKREGAASRKFWGSPSLRSGHASL